MARLHVTTPNVDPAEIPLTPGCNRVGREGENDVLIPHPSVSRAHCEVWLTDDGVLIRDLGSRNGTYVEGTPVHEAQLFAGQKLRMGDVEMVLAEAPVRISVPPLPLPEQPRFATLMPDGTPCCFHHEIVAATLECTSCQRTFCRSCVRELRLAGGVPRRFCPECGGSCQRMAPKNASTKRASWLARIVDAFVKPPPRRP